MDFFAVENLGDLFPWVFLILGTYLVLRGSRRQKVWNRYLERATEHLQISETHMQRMEEKLDQLIAIQARDES